MLSYSLKIASTKRMISLNKKESLTLLLKIETYPKLSLYIPLIITETITKNSKIKLTLPSIEKLTDD